MKTRRLGLSTALSFVAVSAIQFGWLRYIDKTASSLVGLDAPAFDLGISIPVGLLFVFWHLAKPGRFRWGGLIGGLIWFAIYSIVARYRGEWVRTCIRPPGRLVASFVGTSRHNSTLIYSVNSVVFSASFLVLVLTVGYVATLLPNRKQIGLAETPAGTPRQRKNR